MIVLCTQADVDAGFKAP